MTKYAATLPSDQSENAVRQRLRRSIQKAVDAFLLDEYNQKHPHEYPLMRNRRKLTKMLLTAVWEKFLEARTSDE